MVTKQQINHISRLIKQNIIKPDFAIVGGYHGVNLGDIALGESVRLILKKLNFKGGLQTIYNIDRWPWPRARNVIIGGGAIGYTTSLLKVRKVLNEKYDKMAFLGVDFNEFGYDDVVIKMLQGSAWISCRNEYQANRLKELTGRNDISFHPDLVFSYKSEECEKIRRCKKERTLLVNVVPLYGKVSNGLFVPNENYREERPDLYRNYATLISSYRDGLQRVIGKALSEGYRVETVPFTPGDVDAAKALLVGLPIKHNSYDEDVESMLKKVGRAEKIFATRYHATILGIKTGAKVIPMAYATKNDKLFDELGVNSKRFLSSSDLANGTYTFPEEIMIDYNIVRDWEQAASQSVQKCIKTILQN